MLLDPSFPGQNYPPSTIVTFPTTKGIMRGQVRKLNKDKARVAVGSNNTIWKVPYSILNIKERSIVPEVTLEEIYDFACLKLKEFGLPDWKFGFDLAQNRGGVCRYGTKTISLSVTYCLNGSKEELLDTVLHEIAHAMVGPGHGHDFYWKQTAKQIGCKASICHTVKHGLDKWKGTCPCGQQWKRKKLLKRVRNGKCPKCMEPITWTEII